MGRLLAVLLSAAVLAGCATNGSSYKSYSNIQQPPKNEEHTIGIYHRAQSLPSASYVVIGKVEVHDYAHHGVNIPVLLKEAEKIARAKGADAIINAHTKILPYGGTYVPGNFGYYQHPPVKYIPAGDIFVKFSGDLVVFTSNASS